MKLYFKDLPCYRNLTTDQRKHSLYAPKHAFDLSRLPPTDIRNDFAAFIFDRATKINRYFKDKVKTAFGIGTYLANDTEVPPLNIVMKTTACNGMDVAKISDVEGKGMCKNPEYIHYLKRCINWRMENESVVIR